MSTPPLPTLDVAFVASALRDRVREQCGDTHATFTRAVIDSRRVQPGDLFVALPGERVDGHAFIAQAVAAGARGVLASRAVPLDGVAGDAPTPAYFVVDEPLEALQLLAVAWRRALPGTSVIGITGSVGKTTTKNIAAAVLRERYRVHATPLNYNNEIGVPLCLLELTPNDERAVIELGMYTTGEIARLAEWTAPRIGAVLNVGPVHLERAGSLEAIARAKRELIEALPADGHAILNADDPVVAAMAPHTAARIWRFGTGANVDVRGSAVESHGADGFSCTVEAGSERARVRVPLPGAHLLQNVLAATAIGLADEVPFAHIVGALERLDVPVRLTVRRLGQRVTLLDDTYNASPSATVAALDLLRQTPGRRVALLGDMRELGPLSAELHAQVGRYAAGIAEVLLTVGEEAQAIAEAAHAAGLAAVTHHAAREAAIAALLATVRPGDAVLVKGSRALALEAASDALQHALGLAAPESETTT